LIVRAPHHASEDYIYTLILRKESWIKSKQDHFKERLGKISARRFLPGEEFLYLGQAYPLVVREDMTKAVLLGEAALMIASVALRNARDHLEYWYKQTALDYITQRVNHYCQITGLTYQSIRVNEARTRWGSCGYKNTLNFTWRLIMAPPRVVDYVVIHELMHLKQKNHSYKFWAEVYQMVPDYKQDERWLKNNSHFLVWEGV